ncbi:MAG: endonuclease/exonuclease/phosphatase family protein [Candidatus Woesearchaeota archaeon]|jgi:endonuclease/exonuclease/phosphatase family metal-dependent hydrolase
MKIITLNTALAPWSLTRRKRLPLICSVLLREKPNIVALQEVFFKKDAEYLKSVFFKKGFIHSFHCKTLLFISKVPLYNCKYFEFKTQGPLFSWALLDRLYKKAYQIAELRLGKNRLILINTHLLSANGMDKGVYEIIRKKQFLEIINKLKAFKKKKIIITGDFNFDINTKVYNLIDEHSLIDPLRNIFGNTFIGSKYRLDHFFLKNFDKKNIKCKIISKKAWPSDHYGLKLSFI